MAGVVVTLAGLWLSSPNDPADRIHVERLWTLEATPQSQSTVRAYAGGRYRAITLKGTQQQLKVSLGRLERSDVRWVEQHVATLLLVRDPVGRKFYGVYLTADITEVGGDDVANVELTLLEVTHDEAV